MSQALQPNEMRPDDMRLGRRPRRLDRLDVICLAWAGLFAVATGALALALQ